MHIWTLYLQNFFSFLERQRCIVWQGTINQIWKWNGNHLMSAQCRADIYFERWHWTFVSWLGCFKIYSFKMYKPAAPYKKQKYEYGHSKGEISRTSNFADIEMLSFLSSDPKLHRDSKATLSLPLCYFALFIQSWVLKGLSRFSNKYINSIFPNDSGGRGNLMVSQQQESPLTVTIAFLF